MGIDHTTMQTPFRTFTTTLPPLCRHWAKKPNQTHKCFQYRWYRTPTTPFTGRPLPFDYTVWEMKKDRNRSHAKLVNWDPDMHNYGEKPVFGN